MSEAVHKYFCGYCNIFIFGETPARLAGNLNSHNGYKHPADCDNWTGDRIIQSSHYWPPMGEQEIDEVAKELKALPQYTTPYGTTSKNGDWGDAKHPPDITRFDIELLSLNRVKW